MSIGDHVSQNSITNRFCNILRWQKIHRNFTYLISQYFMCLSLDFLYLDTVVYNWSSYFAIIICDIVGARVFSSRVVEHLPHPLPSRFFNRFYGQNVSNFACIMGPTCCPHFYLKKGEHIPLLYHPIIPLSLYKWVPSDFMRLNLVLSVISLGILKNRFPLFVNPRSLYNFYRCHYTQYGLRTICLTHKFWDLFWDFLW